MINFRWIQVFLKEKNRKRHKFIESKKLCRLLLHLLFNLRPRPIDSDLRWKQEPAKKISGLHELKKAVWRILVLLFIDLLEWKPHRLLLAQLQDPSQFKPFLSQLTELSITLLMCRSHIDHWALLENISWAFFLLPGRHRKLLQGYRVFAAMSFLAALQRLVHASSVHSVAGMSSTFIPRDALSTGFNAVLT